MIYPYRGLSLDENSKGQWQYGYLIEDNGKAFIVNEIIEANEQYITIGSWCPVNNESIGRFTGLFDEIDDELFEGDVILWTYWDEFEDEGRAEIVFENGMFKLLDTRSRKEVWDNLFDCIENCNVYLVGDIYRNPELLEADND